MIHNLLDSDYSSLRQQIEWVAEHLKDGRSYKLTFNSEDHGEIYKSFSLFQGYVSPRSITLDVAFEYFSTKYKFLRSFQKSLDLHYSHHGKRVTDFTGLKYQDLVLNLKSNPENVPMWDEHKHREKLKTIFLEENTRLKILASKWDPIVDNIFDSRLLDGDKSAPLFATGSPVRDHSKIYHIISRGQKFDEESFARFEKKMKWERELLSGETINVDLFFNEFPGVRS